MHYVFFCSILLIFNGLLFGFVPPSLTAKHVVLINADSGRVLYEKKGDVPAFPASTTKIATILYALTCKPNGFDERITAHKDALLYVSRDEKRQKNWGKYPAYVLTTDGSQADVKINDVITFKDLLYAVMLESGNDASNVLAHYLGKGSIERFMEGMNQFLKGLGCQSTHFLNPHGLHHPEHITTAKEMAFIAQRAMKHPVFREIVQTVEYEALHSGRAVRYVQSNKLLRKSAHYYEPAIGIKTGYTAMANHAFVAAAKQGDRELIAVLLNTKTRSEIFSEAKQLLDAAFKEKKIEKTYLPKGEQQFVRNFVWGNASMHCYTQADLRCAYYPSETVTPRCQLLWNDKSLPIQAGDTVGVVRLVDGNRIIAEVSLFATTDIKERWQAPCIRVAKKVGDLLYPYGLIVLALLYCIRKLFKVVFS